MHDAVTEFPRSLASYPDMPGASLVDVLWARATLDPLNAVATGIFLLAVLHTFVASRFTAAAHHRQHIHDATRAAAGLPPRPSVSAEMLHFLGEIEVVFGLWLLPLVAAIVIM